MEAQMFLACGPPAAYHTQRNPLFQAIECDDIGRVNLLIDHGWGNVENGEEHKTPLHLAASLGRLNICKALIERAGVALETENGQHTALHYAVAHGHEPVCRYLVERGADVFLRDGNSKTALEVAFMQGVSLSIVAFLRQAEKAASFRNATGCFPLIAATPQSAGSGFTHSQLNLRGNREQEYLDKQVMLEQQHLAKQADLERRHLTAKAESEQRHLGRQAQLERELEEWKAIVAAKVQSEKALRLELETLTHHISSQSESESVEVTSRRGRANVEQRQLERQGQLERGLEELRGVIARQSRPRDVYQVQLDTLLQQIKSQSEAEDLLKNVMARLEENHVKVQARWERELKELKAVVAEKSKAEEACRVELGNLTVKAMSKSVAEDELRENVAKYKAKLSVLSSRLKECEEERDGAVVSCGTTSYQLKACEKEREAAVAACSNMETELASVLEELLDKSTELSELQSKMSRVEIGFTALFPLMNVKDEKATPGMEGGDNGPKQRKTKRCKETVHGLEHDVQDLEKQLEVARQLMTLEKTELMEAQASQTEMKNQIERLEVDVIKKMRKYEALLQSESHLKAAADEKAQQAMKAEEELAEVKLHLTTSLELAEVNCTEAKQRVAELEEASLSAGEKLTRVEALSEEQAKTIASLKQELEGVSTKVASLERKLGRRNQRIEELVEARDAANAKCNVANEKLQATRLKLKDERKANDAKMNSTGPVPDTSTSMSTKRVADSDVIEVSGPSRKKARCADDSEEIGGGAVVVSSTNQKSTTYFSNYDTWYQNYIYCVNMMIAAKGGSTGKWPLSIERASNEKMALSVLDGMMDDETALRSFFKVFEVKMTNAADGKGRGRKKKENTMEHGLDAGGLTNDLLGKVFNGLLEVKVNVLGRSEKKFLFADDENAAWALPLEDHEVTAEAAILYEGVGRLFLKAILSGANTEADTPTLIPDTVFNPCFLHLCLDRGITKSDAGNCMMSSEDVRDALESLLPPDHFGLWSADALIDKSATMNWATGDDADAGILVTHDNHDMYGRKFLERILSTRKVAFEHMKKGFFLTIDHERHGYIPPLKFFNSKQLRVLLCGKIVKPELILSTLNFVDGNHPDETGGEIGHTGDSWGAPNMRDTKQWLIELISQLDVQECEDFLNYCAAVVRIPYARSITDGGGQSNFQIHVIARGGSEKRNALPSSQTCFRKLSLPAYTSYNELQKAFKVAFEHAGGYFGKE